MKRQLLMITVGMGLGVLVVAISGCTTNRVDLVATGVLTLEEQTSGKVYIPWSDAYEDGDGFVVTGVLRRHDCVGYPLKTHVDVTILSADAKVVDQARSSDVYVPRRITGRGQSFKRFKVRFQSIPAKGSKVSAVTHVGHHNDTEDHNNS